MTQNLRGIKVHFLESSYLIKQYRMLSRLSHKVEWEYIIGTGPVSSQFFAQVAFLRMGNKTCFTPCASQFGKNRDYEENE